MTDDHRIFELQMVHHLREIFGHAFNGRRLGAL
jgi:hypothetical protein